MSQLQYRPDVDGFRAIAVLAVLLFHADYPLFAGGYVGVDIFFVISGYLITRIILDHLLDGRFSFWGFYKARIKRIQPALIFYFVLSAAFAFYVLPPHMLKDFSQSLVAAALCLSNVFFYIETDYFNDFSATAPLLHTWSLSVEEQFYLFYPLFLFLIAKIGQLRWLPHILVLAGAVSLGLSVYYSNLNATFAFYQLPIRFWELSAGGFIACCELRGFLPKLKRYGLAINLFGWGLIALSVFSYSPETVFPGYAAAAPVLGAMCIIAYPSENWITYYILQNRLCIYIGLISYSLYLSHHIAFALVRVSHLNFGNPTVRIWSILISFLLSVVSYHYVESKIRRKDFKTGQLLFVVGGCLAVLCCFGWQGHKTDGFRQLKFSKLPEEARDTVLDVSRLLPERKEAWAKLTAGAERPFLNQGEHRTLIVGDSKAQDLYVAFAINPFGEHEVRCLRLQEGMMDAPSSRMPKRKRERLETFLQSSLFANADTLVLSCTWMQNSNSGVTRFVDYLLSEGKQVKVVSTANFNDAASLSYVLAEERHKIDDLEAFFEANIRWDWRKQYLNLEERIREEQLEVQFVDKSEFFRWGEGMMLYDEGGWFIFDSGHLTIHGASQMNKFLREVDWL